MQQHTRDYTEICLKDAYGIYTVQVDEIDMTLTDLVSKVFRSVVLASGYTQGAVDDVLGPYDSERVDESCEYQVDLEKILDALNVDSAERAIENINATKETLNRVRWCAGAKSSEDIVMVVNKLKAASDTLELQRKGNEEDPASLAIQGFIGMLLEANKIADAPRGANIIDVVKELKRKADALEALISERALRSAVGAVTVKMEDGKQFKIERIN